MRKQSARAVERLQTYVASRRSQLITLLRRLLMIHQGADEGLKPSSLFILLGRSNLSHFPDDTPQVFLVARMQVL
jgi:hypothetical protein